MMLLDCARHFFTVNEVKKVLDLLAAQHINTFHWHLTDDQGWRVEIRRYPLLTSSGPYYSQEDVREVVSYAQNLGIEVIPEIEVPGHCSAALSAYPYLGCRGEGYTIKSGMGVWEDVYCPGKEETFRFLEDVFAEVVSLFPSEYVHIGGDECRKERWRECPSCQARIAAEGLGSVEELQGWMLRRVEKILGRLGRKVMAWDEAAGDGLSPSAVITCRYSDERLARTLESGRKVVLCPAYWCYFDYYQSADHEHEPKAHVGVNPNLDLRTAYSFAPGTLYPPERKAQVLGVECCLWTEYIANFDHLMYMLMPRLAAFSEVAWNGIGTDYEDFLQRIEKQGKCAQLPEGERLTHTTYPFYGPDDPLRDGGLIGPAQIILDNSEKIEE